MEPIITAFAQSPDRGRGLARDMPVRWALEEAGIAYRVRLLSFAALKQAEHLALHPFGQIPTFEHGDVRLFESVAIVLHVAEGSPALLPADPAARAAARAWAIAAVATVEPAIFERSMALLFERDRPWHAERLALIEQRIDRQLGLLADRLGTADWLDGAFGAGDLMMVAVLRRLGGSGLIDPHANLAAYVARAEQRPAFQRAFAAQAAVFAASQPITPPG